jgi:hypothetical protein
MRLEFMQQALDRRASRGRELLFAGIANAKEQAVVFPSCEAQPAKTKQHFARLHGRVHRDGSRRQRNDRVDHRTRTAQQRLGLTMRHETDVEIALAPRINMFQRLAGRIALEELDPQTCIKG